MKEGGRKSLLRFVFIGGIVAVGVGLFIFYKRQLALAFAYCYKVSNIKFRDIKKGHILFDLFVKVQNKSKFEVNFMSYDFDIFVNGKQVSHVSQDKPTLLKHQSITEFQVAVDFSPEKLFNLTDALILLSYITADKSKFIVQVVGTVTVKLNFINKKVPINMKYTLSEILAYGGIEMNSKSDDNSEGTSKTGTTTPLDKENLSESEKAVLPENMFKVSTNPNDPLLKCDIK